MPSDKRPHPNGPDQRSPLPTVIVRATIAVVFVGLAFWPVYALVVARDVEPNRIQQLAIYVWLSLMAGIGFTVATSSTGSITMKRLGISLGGGAAIGVAVVVLAHRLLPMGPFPAVITPSPNGLVYLGPRGANVSVTSLGDTGRYLVELRAGPYEASESYVEFLVIDGRPPTGAPGGETIRFEIRRDGHAVRIGDR